MSPSRPLALAALVAVATVLLGAARADAIPVFARRYGISCAQCHHPIPKLTAFGEMFAGHGFRMTPAEEPGDTLSTGDELLVLERTLPLAARIEGNLVYYSDPKDQVDFQAPWVMKVLSSARITQDLSYYFYFLFQERGEVAGVEDAFLYWNDIGGRPLDLAIGQFQVSDPMFKRELRLEYEDYVVYRTSVGDQPADLTYDRGLSAIADVAGFTLTASALNGNGIHAAGDNRRYDDDLVKAFFGHLSRDLVPGLRVAAMGYLGGQDGPDPTTDPVVRNSLWMAGVDATLAGGPIELNLQYVHREDDHPTFTPGERRAVMDGGFAELLWLPEESRWYGYALYNRVESNYPVLDFGLGGSSPAQRYQSAAAGAGRLVARNIRVQLEGQYDLEEESARVAGTFVLAY
jgi:hypothetical protein